MNMYGTSSHNLETMDEKKKKEKWILPEKKKRMGNAYSFDWIHFAGRS